MCVAAHNILKLPTTIHLQNNHHINEQLFSSMEESFAILHHFRYSSKCNLPAIQEGLNRTLNPAYILAVNIFQEMMPKNQTPVSHSALVRTAKGTRSTYITKITFLFFAS